MAGERADRDEPGNGDAGAPDSEVRRLMRTPPAQFVAERNRLAKELRAAGQRDRAAAIAGLRRPRPVDWALDVAAAEHADATAGFVDAANALAAAQQAIIEGREGADLRAATRALRERTAELARLGVQISAGIGRAPDSFVAEVTARLTAVAANPTALTLLEAGLLGTGDEGTAELFEGLEPADRPANRQAPTRRPAKRQADDPPARRPPRPSRGQGVDVSARRRALAAAEQASGAAAAALAAAERKVARLAERTARARRDAEDAEARAVERRRRFDEASAELEGAERDRAALLAEADAATSAVEAARRAVGEAR